MKEELINQLTLLLHEATSADMEDIKNALFIVFKNYEVKSSKKEIQVYRGNVNEELLKRFLLSKKVQGCTDKTLKAYANTARMAFRKIPKVVTDWTVDDIRIFSAYRLTRDHVSKRTLSSDQRCLSSFFTWLTTEGHVQRNVVVAAGITKAQKTKKKALNSMEIEQVRSQISSSMEEAMLEVLLSTGCRVNELVNIKVDELENDKIIVHGKGQKDRRVYLNAKAHMAVERFLQERADSNPYLFPRGKSVAVFRKRGCQQQSMREWFKDPENVEQDGHLSVGTVEHHIKRMGEKVNVSVHPHKLRRTFATMSLSRGMSLIQVSKLLGHESLETTQIYLDINESDLEQAHRKYVA